MQLMKNACLFLIAAMLLSLVGGCSSGGGAGAASLVGKYKAEMDIPPGKEKDPGVEMAKAMLGSMTLEFKADNTFTMTMMLPMEGTYTVSGDTVEMTMTKVMGMTMEEAAKMGNKPMPAEATKPMKMRIENGGKTLIPIENSPNKGGPEMKFIKM